MEMAVIEFRRDIAGRDVPDLNTPEGQEAARGMIFSGKSMANFPPGSELETVMEGGDMVVRLRVPYAGGASNRLGMKLMLQNMMKNSMPKEMQKHTAVSVYFEKVDGR